jgi:hypothetical protein
MKNSVLFIGMALVTLTNVCNGSNLVNMKRNSLGEINISNDTRILEQKNRDKNAIVYEVIESINANKIGKTIEELFAEDNAITENNISNDTQSLDFNVINRNSIVEEVIETPTSPKIEKTADQLIAEDNLITENNISNETLALDFEIINKKFIPVTGFTMN